MSPAAMSPVSASAAGQAALESAGGHGRTLSGAPLRYGKPGFRNPDFIASGFQPAPISGAA